MRKIFLLLLLVPGICFGQDRWFSSIISVNINSFGASTNSSDNRAAIMAARDYIYSNPVAKLTLYIPKGVYQISDSIKFDKAIRILGEGTIGQPASIFVFPEGKKGLIFSFANGANGFGADVQNLAVTGQFTAGYNNTTVHGITIRTRVYFNNVHVTQYDGNGFFVSACGIPPSGDNNNYGNADHSIFLNCSATFCTNGFYSEGCDAHIHDISDCNFSQNRRWGYFGRALLGDKLDNVHFAFNGVAVPGAKSVVTYAGKYYVAKSGYDGYWIDATDSNFNKQPDISPDYWMEVTATMVPHGAWANNIRYYSGGAAIVKGVNAWTKFDNCYTEGGQPPVVLNTRSIWEYGTNGAGVVAGALTNVLYGEHWLQNAGSLIEKYQMVGTLVYDASTIFKVYNDYNKTQSRVVFKGEGTTTEVYLDLKNNTGKKSRLAYISDDLKIYTKDDSLGLTINDVGVTAKKYFGDGSALIGITANADSSVFQTKYRSDTGRTNVYAALDGKQAAGSYAASSHNHDGVYQPSDGDLDYLAGFTPSANVKSILNAADNAAVKTLLAVNNVDNTSDANKPVSTAQATAISGRGYTLNVQALTSSPTDAQTIYFGQLPKAPISTANVSKVYIRKAGTIKMAQLYCYSGTAGTNESWSIYIRVNNTTDNLIATVSAATSERIFSNTGLNISVNVGDYIEIKSVNPTWATNPLTTIFGGYIYIE